MSSSEPDSRQEQVIVSLYPGTYAQEDLAPANSSARRFHWTAAVPYVVFVVGLAIAVMFST
ncbi:hypothetical protein [Variovorax sp. OV700]|uniref:hypothetical protein n=1 Tax=Variovorax sp. OV700 TaxID=1882826 RepID=UPI00088CBD41|nr:hypothetical protein [Variovorax sp. OV700]SDH85066.1 hypothetical protein SAMN05444748_102645 [Variovorax sp. OV700]